MRIKCDRKIYIKDDDILYVDDATYEYIRDLKKKLHDSEREYSKLQGELNAIKPVVKSEKWKPAMSVDCGECEYVVRSSWNNDILGCRKNNVCEDFKHKEN